MKKMSDGIDVALSIDTTGSMFQCLAQVRRKAKETVTRILKDTPNARIAVIAHGDYCDKGSTYVVKALDFSSDLKKICDFIGTVGPTDGGDWPECYELVLHDARSLSWRAGAAKALVMIGDDVPHGPDYPANTKRIDWKNELHLLLEAGINVYGVHAMPGIRTHSKWFYEAIAKETGGYYLTLDQFAAVNDILLAICYKQSGGTQLGSFQKEIQGQHRMNRNLAKVFTTLSGIAIIVETRPGLIPVPPGRFQVMDVDADQAIKDFVLEQGLNFKKGRGFYEFTKTETIQERKEIVLMDKKTGDMFTGEEAREMIDLPYGSRGRIKPVLLDEFDIFVQSTSVNRKLKAGTKFLYEVEDWDKD
jgi:hypothetical protein